MADVMAARKVDVMVARKVDVMTARKAAVKGSVTASGLSRTLGFWDAVFFELGGIIGAGVFVLIGLATAKAGPLVVLAVALAGVVSLFTALSYAQIASGIGKEGGEYAFARELVNPLAGALMGVGLIISDVASSAVVSLGFASYAVLALPGAPKTLLALAALAAVTLVNLQGARLSANATKLVALTKIAVLVLFILAALSEFQPANLLTLAPGGLGGVAGGAALFFFAFSGFGKVSRLAEEVQNPNESIPKAILTALAISTVLYVLVALALVGSVGWAAASATQSPLADVLVRLGNPKWAVIVTIGALAATLSVLLTSQSGASRVVYALGRDYSPLARLGKLNAKSQSPTVAIIAMAVLSGIVVLALGDLSGAATLSSVVLLAFYAIVNALALVQRAKPGYRERFRIPGGALVPILGLVTSVLLAVGALALSTP